MINVTGDEPFHDQVSVQTLPVNLCRSAMSVVTKGNYLFLFGTEAEHYRPIAVRFNVKRNAWLDLKAPPYDAYEGMAATLLQNNIYLLGGRPVNRGNQIVHTQEFSASTSLYSIETNSWTELENLPRRVAYHAAASHGNYVFSAGGHSTESTNTAKVYAFDVVAKIWLSKASMNFGRQMFSLEALGSKLIACGGYYSPTVEIYDIQENQ